MATLEEQLLEYVIDPQSVDLKTIIRTVTGELRNLRSQIRGMQAQSEKDSKTIKGLAETLRRKNELIKRLEKRGIEYSPSDDVMADSAEIEVLLRDDDSEELAPLRDQFFASLEEGIGTSNPTRRPESSKGEPPHDEVKKRGRPPKSRTSTRR